MAGEDIEFITFDDDNISKNGYREEIIEQYINPSTDNDYDEVTKVSDFTVGSEALHLADIAAGLMFEARVEIDGNYRMSMIHFMEGEILDNYGDMRGVHRRMSSPSNGIVTFTRNEGVTDEIIIPDGLVVATDDAISFIVDLDDETLTIPSGENTAEARVICEQDGAFTNILPNSISIIMDNVGLTEKVSVTNSETFIDGADIEGDDEYRNRILLSPSEAPTGGETWYENLALSVIADSGPYKDEPVIHDAFVQRNLIGDYDMSIFYNPTHRDDLITPYGGSEMLRATYELESLFNTPDYKLARVRLELDVASQQEVLKSVTGITYYIGVILDSDYTLAMVEDDIKAAVDTFNSELLIGIEVNPSNLASLVEDIEGINVCKIIKKEDDVYTECTSQIDIDYNKVGMVSSTIKSNIVEFSFNLGLDIDVEEEL